MDPNETLKMALTYLADGEEEEARDLFEAITLWMMKGGFAPTVKANPDGSYTIG